MPQGPRGGWLRAVCTGLGIVLGAGAIGCQGLDKDKDTKIGGSGKAATPGLPGTPTLPGQPGSGSGVGMGAAKTGQPGYNSPYAGVGTGSGLQQTGGVGAAPAGRGGSPTGFGAGASGGAHNSVPSDGMNHRGSVIPNVGPAGGSAHPAPAGFGAGTAPGSGTSNYAAPAETNYRSSPPAPELMPLPPVPPGSSPGASVSPPGGPMAPIR